MTTAPKRVLILSDYEALSLAIELKLNRLPGPQVVRLDETPTGRPAGGFLPGELALVVVAAVLPTSEPISMLFRVSLLRYVGDVPLLIISERPSRVEPNAKITYLNFPFDMDELEQTARNILDENSQSACLIWPTVAAHALEAGPMAFEKEMGNGRE